MIVVISRHGLPECMTRIRYFPGPDMAVPVVDEWLCHGGGPPRKNIMSPKEVPEKKGQSFSMYLLVFMVVLVVFIVGFLTANYYFYAKNTFDQESAYMQVQTERNVEEAMRLTDTAANILDNSMNDRMLAGLNEVNNEYERVGRDPARMDLDSIKTKLGEGFDIYVINESGVIVETTYAPELGQDFRQVPYFYKYLTTIRLSGASSRTAQYTNSSGPASSGNMLICRRRTIATCSNLDSPARRSTR